MKKPIIGISGSQFTISEGVFAGYQRAYVNNNYVKAIAQAGGIPIILPVTDNLEDCKDLIAGIDGLLLSGGHDIYPLNYGEEPRPELGEVFPERDAYEMQLIKDSMEAKIPIMGICRGHQLLNVYFGGSLFQDLKYDPNCYIKHSQGSRPGLGTHTMDIDEDSKLAQIMDRTSWIVNSHHHQTVNRLGEGLVVTARTKDGTVEAMEYRDYPYLVSYQFHPEMMVLENDEAAKLFDDFISFINQHKK